MGTTTQKISPDETEKLTDEDRKKLGEAYHVWSQGKYFRVGVKQEECKDSRPRSIEICPLWGTTAPDEYVTLENDFEHTLSVLRTLFPEDDPSSVIKFNEYFWRLTDLARAVLGQDQARFGALGLKTFQDEIVMREGGRIKNNYVISLGLWTLAFGALVFGAFLVSETYLKDIIKDRNFFLLLIGGFLGAWLSFSIRKTVLIFDELAVPEKDRLHPAVRLLFVAGLTMVVALLFATGAVSVTIGAFDTDFMAPGGAGAMKAILIGCLCGIGEQALPPVVAQRSSEFVTAIGGTVPAKPKGGGQQPEQAETTTNAQPRG